MRCCNSSCSPIIFRCDPLWCHFANIFWHHFKGCWRSRQNCFCQLYVAFTAFLFCYDGGSSEAVATTASVRWRWLVEKTLFICKWEVTKRASSSLVYYVAANVVVTREICRYTKKACHSGVNLVPESDFWSILICRKFWWGDLNWKK